MDNFRFLLGGFAILMGVWTLLTPNWSARSGARQHKALETRFPWMYRYSIMRWTTAEGNWRKVSPIMGVACIVAGVVVLVS